MLSLQGAVVKKQNFMPLEFHLKTSNRRLNGSNFVPWGSP